MSQKSKGYLLKLKKSPDSFSFSLEYVLEVIATFNRITQCVDQSIVGRPAGDCANPKVKLMYLNTQGT